MNFLINPIFADDLGRTGKGGKRGGGPPKTFEREFRTHPELP